MAGGRRTAAILAKRLTATELVKLYLARIRAYNGTCVEQPDGILGPIKTIPHAGRINALQTLNLRPAARAEWGFDERKARSMTDSADADLAMPDALETAADLDAQFAATGKLVRMDRVRPEQQRKLHLGCGERLRKRLGSSHQPARIGRLWRQLRKVSQQIIRLEQRCGAIPD